MRATTYLSAAEQRADWAQDHAERIWRISVGKPVNGTATPRENLEWVTRDAILTSRLVAAVLARSSDPYIRDRALDQDAKAARALKAASYDVDRAEDAFYEAEA